MDIVGLQPRTFIENCIFSKNLEFKYHVVRTQIFISTGMLKSPYPDLLPDVFCLMVRIFNLMLVLLYTNSTNIPPIMIINRIYEHQNLLSL
jgi:hypothetical protein